MLKKDYIDVSPTVLQALNEHKPVVALESTIISHGMPYPHNVETAHKLEGEIIEQGATPATIAIMDGKIKVGLTQEELTLLATSDHVVKASRRDIPSVIAKRQLGATTVAGTMIGASLAGIHFFATGGIGGVHREGQNTFDISADLLELARTNVCVVCAGAKAILDLPLTLEYLETHGVPVIGYNTMEFPAFYSRTSGILLEDTVTSPEEAAHIVKVKWDMGLDGGIVMANPIPQEKALDKGTIDKIITDALEKANTQSVAGKEVTPFLLSQIEKQTGGESLTANIALAQNNAQLAAKIARYYAKERTV